MAWRFKASKYKNAVPIVPKPENYVRDISVGSYQTYGNNITASSKFMAFNWDHSGSSLGVLPIDDSGRKSKLMPLLHAHSDTVTDMEFSPFHDGLLATGSQDCLVKIWHIPEDGLQESLNNPECIFSHKQRRVETVGFHPIADFLIHSTSYTTINLWDLLSEDELYSNSDCTDVIQSVSWKRDGTLIAISSKDKQVRILDPRIEKSCMKQANSHQSIKDSRIVWLGDSNRILTTGFDAQRLRQIIIRDLRNFQQIEKSLELDCSTGILIPLYDPDTGMLFLAGKGDTTIGYMEVTDKEPYLIEGIRHSGEQTKGACLVPKRALNVMQGEVNRILQLTSSSVIPITYQVPRKTYRDFHSDLYPETPGYKTELIASDWMLGKNIPLEKISLDPAKREKGEEPITIHRGPLSKLKQEYQNEKNAKFTHNPPKITATLSKNDSNFEKDKPTTRSPQPSSDTNKIIDNNDDDDDNNKVIESSNDRINVLEENLTVIQQQQQTTIIPPKPLPRTSRTGSLCDSVDETANHVNNNNNNNNFNNNNNNNIPKPVARPRTNSVAPIVTSVNPNLPIGGGYKPRLGPKPFTPPKLNETESFDKVFSVPPVPGQVTQQQSVSNGVHTNDNRTEIQPPEKNLSIDIITKDESDCKEETTNDYIPKTPSTAERRKLFENRSNSKENEPTNDDTFDLLNDQTNNFERASIQRTSIAERRKMYENRSQSVQETTTEKTTNSSPIMLRRKDSLKNKTNQDKIGKNENLTIPTPKRTSTVFGRVSKFRHLKGTPAHKSQHIENIRNLSRQIPGECDGFHANPDRVAVPLGGPGGKIAIFELCQTGKLPDGVIPALVHGSNIMDFMWDPFDNQRLAVACDDGVIKLWYIPIDGLQQQTNECENEFNAHLDKIYFIKFHPIAKDVLASGSYDMTVKIWNLTTLEEKILLKGHTDQIFSFAWSPCGGYCATVCKDTKIRVYKPRTSDVPIRDGKGPVGSRGARIVWALDGNFLITTGFDKVSERQIMVFNCNDLNNPLNTIGLDVSPAILIPFYDEDSLTLFVTGKGDSTIYAFEITEESPYICALSHHRCNNLHQGLSFLTKNVCDVANVEFAKALRLTNNTIEPLSFTVPRIKTELFQDDLFPPTKIVWQPTLTSTEWFNGKDKTPARINLKPDGMNLLSETQTNTTTERTINKSASTPFIGASQPFNRLGWNVELAEQTKMKQEEIQKSVSSKLGINLKLEQDDMEGVDESEWNE